MFDIETHGLTKKFGDLVAVHNLTLQVPQGTIFGFRGQVHGLSSAETETRAEQLSKHLDLWQAGTRG